MKKAGRKSKKDLAGNAEPKRVGRPPKNEKPVDKAAQKKLIRKEISDKHPETGVEMTPKALFYMNIGQLWPLDKTRIFLFNQTRSHVENNILVQSPRYPEVLEMRRRENVPEDKEEMGRRKKETAKLVKEVLAEQLGMTQEEAQAFVYNIAVFEAEHRVPYNAMVLATEDLLRECEAYMEENLLIWGTKDNPGWLRSVRGIGVKLGAKLISIVKDYERFKGPSSLWAYCGVGDASNEKRKEGVQLHHNPKARSLMFVIADCLVKLNPDYKKVYNGRKARTLITHPEWHGIREEGAKNMNPGHADKDARRVMIKHFLLDFWLECHKADGKMAPSKPFEKAA